MFELIFNINNLIAPCIQEKLEAASTVAAKTEILLSVVELSDLSMAEIEEISSHYSKETGESFDEQFVIDSDTRDTILEYAEKINDFTKVKTLIGNICKEQGDMEREGESIENARRELAELEEAERVRKENEKKEKEKAETERRKKHEQEEKEKRERIVRDLIFDDSHEHTKIKRKHTTLLSKKLSRAKRVINKIQSD